jgi:ribose 5-phosphate isomerase A
MSEEEKVKAAREAVSYIEDGQTVGIGSGSTVNLFIRELVQSGRKITAVPSSYSTLLELAKYDLPVTTLNHVTEVPVTFDGADEVDNGLNLIKGGGGAMTREKILAYSSRKLVIMVDSSKLVKVLGERFPLPVEVIMDAIPLISKTVKQRYSASLVMRTGRGKLPPLLSDNGLILADIEFPHGISRPELLEEEIKAIPGVLENGLFTKHRNVTVVVGTKDGVRLLKGK